MFSSNIEVFAKSNGTSLRKHTGDCEKIAEIILKSKNKLLKNRLKLLDISYDNFKDNVIKSAVFHDFGKATDEWQEWCENKDTSKPNHAPYSGYFFGSINKDNMISLLSVISHHTLLTENSFEKTDTNMTFNKDSIEYLREIADDYNYPLKTFKNLNYYIETLKKFKHNTYQLRELYSSQININFKAEYCLTLLYLTIADGQASYYENINKKIDEEEIKYRYPSPEQIYNSIQYLTKDKKPTPIQDKINNIELQPNTFNKQVILEAPCGEGKTLASLLYAKKLLNENLIDKVIFVLPTQVTSNNMYTEFNEEYNIPEEEIGIYHSEVISFLMKNQDIDDSSIYLEKYDYLIYSKPFNISTIDHLLLTLVNGYRHATKGFGNLLNSLVIIDELHYYDQYTLSLIEVFCDILNHLKIPCLIMTATMPSFIKNRFSDTEYKKIESEGCNEEKIEKNPYNIQYHNTTIYKDKEFTTEFREIIHENINKDIGIIVNTVKQSKTIYNTLRKTYPDKQILLYNSQFMKKDRPIKEKLLKYYSNHKKGKQNQKEQETLKKYNINPNKNLIFIGTQVAEISLNISFDVLLSEIAPLDALIQRGGRLHRSQTYNNSKECNCKQCQKLENHRYIFHIFNTGEYCYPYYTKDDNNIKKEIINNTREIIKENRKYTFQKSKQWINKVYPQNIINKKEYNANKQKYRNIITEDIIFGKNPTFNEEEEKTTRIKTREINTIKRQVLPSQIITKEKTINIKKILNKYKKQEINDTQLTEYMININNTKTEITNHEINNNNINVINMKYSFEQGLY